MLADGHVRITYQQNVLTQRWSQVGPDGVRDDWNMSLDLGVLGVHGLCGVHEVSLQISEKKRERCRAYLINRLIHADDTIGNFKFGKVFCRHDYHGGVCELVSRQSR